MSYHRMALLSLVLAVAAVGGEQPPQITHIGMVLPDVIGITVQVGHVEYGTQMPYEPQPNDKVGTDRSVTRDGKFLGALVGKDRKIICTPDRVVGARLDTAWADRTDSYRITSADDPNYAQGLVPSAVFRKSKPSDLARMAMWQFDAPVEHVIYLRLPKALTVGKGYTIAFKDGKLAEQTFVYDPATLRSEAVHISHLGFRPSDPAKVAFLSCWMGSGGGIVYPEKVTFRVLDENGKAAFQGEVVLSKAATDKTEDAYKRNYNGVNVYMMDFSPLNAPGTYRVSVEGIGCSYPFGIAEDSWRKAYIVSARGFYHQRSGIELGPPYTTFKRPRAFHPDDGVKVYQSTTSLMGSGNGLTREGSNFGNLVKGKTDKLVDNAWGGYMDAGDWDRRIQHLDVSRALLDLVDLFPDYFASINLNIPESGNNLPDTVDEALFNIDFYRRLQLPDGAIRGGIESEEHPRPGEASWQESLTIMCYAPDVWSSYLYAGVAARAAYWLDPRDANLAKVYRNSALQAMQWAEAEMEKTKDTKYPIEVRDARNLAAIELFRLTGDAKRHDLFLATTFFKDPKAPVWEWQSHDQREAAWVYLRTNRPGLGADIKGNCLNALRREADERAAQCDRTGFRYTKNPYRPVGWACLTSPDAIGLVRVHALTADAKYLRSAVLTCQTGAGANPVNMCYTTGLGHKSPQHPLHIDSRISHQPAPAGLTIFGPTDPDRYKDNWQQKLVAPYCYPPVLQWPPIEAYWDVFWYPEMCEFTVQAPMAENAYVWGYLAARK